MTKALAHAEPPVSGAANLLMTLQAEASGALAPIGTPWLSLDHALSGGLRPGQVTILAGSAGAAKSYLAFRLLLHIHKSNLTWRVLPLEDEHSAWLRRCVAIREDSWRIMEDPAAAERALQEDLPWASDVGHHIHENPRKPVELPDGRKHVLSVDWPESIRWIEEAVTSARIVAVDPLCQVEFDGDPKRPEWQAMGRFMQGAVAAVAGTRAHLLLCAHVVKRQGRDADRPLTLDSLQGAAALTRLAHNVLLLDRTADPVEHAVLAPGGARAMVEHKMTLTVAKSRNGRGVGARIAMDFSQSGPRIVEHGVILPKER